VALNRGNISDSLMILLVVLAADAASAAIVDGSQRRLILAGVWVGLAFQAKMIEAWEVLPALGAAYLLGGPGATGRRLRQLGLAGVVTAVVSLAWMTVVTVVPPSHRPYVDGSHDNSVFQQVFVYNGFGRFGEQTPLQLLAGQNLGIGKLPTPAAGPNRLFRGDLGRDTAWLIPAAVVAALWGVAGRRRQPRGDPLRACFVLWGLWLLTLGVTFSVTSDINSYYTAALTPAVAAILGAGVAAMWSQDRTAAARRIGLAVIVLATVAYAAWLVPSSGSHVPGWLAPTVIALGVVAAATIVISVLKRTDNVLASAIGVGLSAALLAPAVASAELVAHHQGAFDTPFEPPREADFIVYQFVQLPARVKLTIPRLESAPNPAPYLLATQTAAVASVFIYPSGREVLPIGGFTGTIPSPTLSQLQADIRRGRFHLVLASAKSTDPRLVWIAKHCLPIGSPIGALQNYYCLPSNAGP
jgi:4-amino-4-deoxy-L-arabinose transferase-like glycosyltransferase